MKFDIQNLLNRISNLEFKDRGYHGECLEFAIALKNIIKDSEIYSIYEKNDKCPFHFLIKYEGYFFDSNTVMNEKKFMKKLEKQKRNAIKETLTEDGRNVDWFQIADQKLIDEFIELFK
jgi:hypothetical protein